MTTKTWVMLPPPGCWRRDTLRITSVLTRSATCCGLPSSSAAVTEARTLRETDLLVLPPAEFHRLVAEARPFARFFDRSRPAPAAGAEAQRGGLAVQRVDELIAGEPLSVGPGTTLREAAERMRDAHVSSLAVTEEDGRLTGIVTVRDLEQAAAEAALAALEAE